MRVILDTNIWVSFLYGKHMESVAQLFVNPNIEIYVSEELIHELKDVLSRPKHTSRISSNSIQAMWILMDEYCKMVTDYEMTMAYIRDPKDLYLLSMAEAIDADYLVTGDIDILVLGKHLKTQIVTYRDFLQILKS